MYDSLIRTEEYKGCKIELHYDLSPESPRDWGWKDVIYSNHRNINPDNHTIDEILDDDGKISKEFKETHVYLSLYSYSHGGTTIRTTPFNDRFDSGFFGIIAISKDNIKKETGHKIVTKKDRENYIRFLEGRVEVYDQYINGQVYGYVALGKDGEELHSCWGYFGDEDDCISDAKDIVESHLKDLEHQACDFWSGENVA